MAVTSLVTAAAHLVQIVFWAILLLFVAKIPNFDRALYLSAQNYTALGYRDVILPVQWQLLDPLEAINGLLLFGLSTAVMSRLVNDCLRFKLRSRQVGRQDAGMSH